MNYKNKTFNLCIFIIICILVFSILYKTYEKPDSVANTENNILLDSNLHIEDFLADKSLPPNLDILGVVSKEKIIVLDNTSIKEYLVSEDSYGETIATISSDCYIKESEVTSYGICWVESSEKTDANTIFFKDFNSDSINKIDTAMDNIIPQVSLNENYLSYCIGDSSNNKTEIKVVNLKDFSNKSIFVADAKIVGVEKDKLPIPSLYKDTVVWSAGNSKDSILYSYNITNDKLETLKENSPIFAPTLYKENLYGIKFETKTELTPTTDNTEIPMDYCSDYIVKYNQNNNSTEEIIGENNLLKNKEYIGILERSDNYLYWLGGSNTEGYLYDLDSTKLISLNKSNIPNHELSFQILGLNDNTLVYKVKEFGHKGNIYMYNLK